MPSPLPGDILSRTSDLLVDHFGIAVNRHLVLDIVPGGAPRIVSLARFAAGRPFRLAHRPNRDELPAIFARVRQGAASKDVYDVLTNNCEHLKNFVLSGESYSESVRFLLGCIAVVGLCAFLRGRAN